MKFVEITGGILQPVSNEENIVLEMVKGYGSPIPKRELDERQQEIARSLVTRGLLTRFSYNGKLCFVANELEEMPRS